MTTDLAAPEPARSRIGQTGAGWLLTIVERRRLQVFVLLLGAPVSLFPVIFIIFLGL